MKTDPFIRPLNLAIQHGGKWSYKDEKTGAVISRDGFWETALALSNYRRRNGLPRWAFEDCQMDVLVAKRKELGLPLELRETTPTAAPGGIPGAVSPVLGVAVIKQKKGCAGCGKTKPL